MATLLTKIHSDPRYDENVQNIWLSALNEGLVEEDDVTSDFRNVIDQSLQNIVTLVSEFVQNDSFTEDVGHAMRDRDYPNEVDTPFVDPARAEYIDRAKKGVLAAVGGVYDPPDDPVVTSSLDQTT